MAVRPEPLPRRDVVPQAARRAVERAVIEHGRLRDSVKETVAPVTNHRPIQLFRQTFAKAWSDRVWGLSAEAAFWQLLSIPPLVLALLGSFGYVSEAFFGQHTVDAVHNQLLSSLHRVLTPNVVDLISPTVNDVLNRGRADVISIGFVISLWAGSSAMATFVNTITIAYDMRDMRGAVRSRLIALWLYIVTMVVSIVLLPTLVLGPAKIVNLFPDNLHSDVGTLVHDLYWPIVGVLLLCGLTSLYHLAVPIRRPWHRGLPGAVLAGLIFLLGSYLLRIYVNFVVKHAYSYGALAAPIAALLFLFVLALAILLGAEFNATIEQMWPSPPTRRERRRARKLEAAERAFATGPRPVPHTRPAATPPPARSGTTAPLPDPDGQPAPPIAQGSSQPFGSNAQGTDRRPSDASYQPDQNTTQPLHNGSLPDKNATGPRGNQPAPDHNATRPLHNGARPDQSAAPTHNSPEQNANPSPHSPLDGRNSANRQAGHRGPSHNSAPAESAEPEKRAAQSPPLGSDS